MSKEVLATDIDEVLLPFASEFAKWHNQEYGTELSQDDFHSYEFEQVLKLSVPESIHRIHTFLSEDYIHTAVSPLQGAQDALSDLSGSYKIAAITARHPQFEGTTKACLTRYFSEITDLVLVGHKETMATVRSKAEVCQEIGAIALVDDSVAHVTGCVEAGLGGILFGKYPWQTQDGIHSLVVPLPD